MCCIYDFKLPKKNQTDNLQIIINTLTTIKSFENWKIFNCTNQNWFRVMENTKIFIRLKKTVIWEKKYKNNNCVYFYTIVKKPHVIVLRVVAGVRNISVSKITNKNNNHGNDVMNIAIIAPNLTKTSILIQIYIYRMIMKKKLHH